MFFFDTKKCSYKKKLYLKLSYSLFSLARYKLKFSPDKVDTMVIQAVNLLEDLDKELNNYVMRAKEWYGWHFPELAKILTDNTSYILTIMKMGQYHHLSFRIAYIFVIIICHNFFPP